jgi:hypothetical protein
MIAGQGIGGHHRPYRGQTDEWLTPPEIIAALGQFDLDPCSPINRVRPANRVAVLANNKVGWKG